MYVDSGDVKSLILTNLYWLSLVLIGFCILSFFRNLNVGLKTLKNISSFIFKQHPFFIALVSFFVSVLLYAIISIPFYIFHWPVEPFTIIYLVLLALSVIYFIVLIYKLAFKKSDIFHLADQTLLVKMMLFGFILFLIIDFVIAQCVGSFAWGDATYHMSRVVDILASGFNIQSSFHSNLLEGSYQYNVIYSLYAVAAKLFNMAPIIVWQYSLGFFRLLEWLATFSLALVVFGKWLKLEKYRLPLAILATISTVAFVGYFIPYGYVANYPNVVILIWFILLAICLLQPVTKNNYKAVMACTLSLSVVIAMTHTLYSMITVCFLGMLIVVRLILQRKEFLLNKFNWLIYILSMSVLMTTPVLLKLAPTKLQSDLINLGFHGYTIFGIEIIQPPIPTDIIGWLLLLAFIVSAIYILVKLRKNKLEWSIAFCLLFFYPIVAYTPICTIVGRFLPLWTVFRFNDMSILSRFNVLIAIVGIIAFIYWLSKKLKISIKPSTAIKRIGYMAFIVIYLCALFIPLRSEYGDLFSHGNYQFYNTVKPTLQSYSNILDNNVLVVTGPDYGYDLSSMLQIDVISLTYGHAPLTSDGADRLTCLNHILDTYNYSDLKAVGAKYVITWVGTSGDSLAKSKQYLHLVRTTPDNLYSFDASASHEDTKVFEPCLRYQEVENH